MNTQKFTQKSIEAIESAQQMALSYGNPELTQSHLLWALTKEDGVINSVLKNKGGMKQYR